MNRLQDSRDAIFRRVEPARDALFHRWRPEQCVGASPRQTSCAFSYRARTDAGTRERFLKGSARRTSAAVVSSPSKRGKLRRPGPGSGPGSIGWFNIVERWTETEWSGQWHWPLVSVPGAGGWSLLSRLAAGLCHDGQMTFLIVPWYNNNNKKWTRNPDKL